MLIIDRLQRLAAAIAWAARQAEKQMVKEGRLRAVARRYPDFHPWKITREAVEWCRSLPADHSWHLGAEEQPPPGTVLVGDLAVTVDAAPAFPELEGVGLGPLPGKYRRGESESEWADRIFDERFPA